MNKLFSGLSHIPNTEVKSDIRITKIEIKDYQDELDVLERNPVENKLRIYMLNGKINERKTFVDKLTSLLDYRKKKKAV